VLAREKQAFLVTSFRPNPIDQISEGITQYEYGGWTIDARSVLREERLSGSSTTAGSSVCIANRDGTTAIRSLELCRKADLHG